MNFVHFFDYNHFVVCMYGAEEEEEQSNEDENNDDDSYKV